jgi:hypothetical protein
MNGVNKLECYNTLDLKGLPRQNTLIYWAHTCVTKEYVLWILSNGSIHLGMSYSVLNNMKQNK